MTTLFIRLEFSDHDTEQEAYEVVNDVLDAGILQDTINGWHDEGLFVKSATVQLAAKGDGR